jgi:hypothetical protein
MNDYLVTFTLNGSRYQRLFTATSYFDVRKLMAVEYPSAVIWSIVK